MSSDPIGHLNIVLGWGWLSIGLISGLLPGLKVPQFGSSTQDGQTEVGSYGSVSRRLMRLGPIAFITFPLR